MDFAQPYPQNPPLVLSLHAWRYDPFLDWGWREYSIYPEYNYYVYPHTPFWVYTYPPLWAPHHHPFYWHSPYRHHPYWYPSQEFKKYPQGHPSRDVRRFGPQRPGRPATPVTPRRDSREPAIRPPELRLPSERKGGEVRTPRKDPRNGSYEPARGNEKKQGSNPSPRRSGRRP